MDSYNNDYNKDLYTAESNMFCKSCYSSQKSRSGCLVCIVASVVICFLYFVLARITSSGKTAAVVLAAAAVAFVILRYLKRRNKKQ